MSYPLQKYRIKLSKTKHVIFLKKKKKKKKKKITDLQSLYDRLDIFA